MKFNICIQFKNIFEAFFMVFVFNLRIDLKPFS